MSAKLVFVAFCAILGVAFASMEHEMVDHCIEKLELDKATFKEWLTKRPVETDDPKYKCFFKCLFMETKWMDDNGNISDEPGVKVEEDFLTYGKQCRTEVQGADVCEKAFNFHKCIMDKKGGQ